MTRSLADEADWDDEAIERRANDLAQRALNRWPWLDQSSRCDVEPKEESRTQAFWRFLKNMGGVPGQEDWWLGPSQWTAPINSRGDKIGIYVGNPEWLWLYIRSGESQASAERTAQMRQYSWLIREQMSDQNVGDNLKDCANGRSVDVYRRWTPDDEEEWPESAVWLLEQCDRLRAILVDEAS